jgi:RNA polymerase sigma factor (sigma-70 family)
LIRRLPATDPALADTPLVRAFQTTRSDAAFAELVRRHGPMVLAACRRALGNPDDAEDAFQAVFLVLARKAHTVRGNLAGWLYAVAVRTARGVRIMRERRRKHETRASNRCEPAVPPATDHDLAAVIDEELARLPEHHRLAVVLCELRGQSRKQAAAELGIPEGTLASRLAAAKRKLAALLSARGLAPAALVASLAPASVSAGLIESAVSAVRGTAGPVASAAASAVVKGMLFDHLRAVALAAGMVLTVVCGGWAMTGTPGGSNPTPPTAPAPRLADDPAAKLVDQLGAPAFADRENAAKHLRALGVRAEPALKAALPSDDPEVRQRVPKILAEIRGDRLRALVREFDPAKEQQPDHPLWHRFRAITGDTRAARELFAAIIKNANWLRRLDTADANPDAALRQYREAVLEVGRQFDYNLRVFFEIPVWPCDCGDEVAFLLFLGSYPNTASIPSGGDPARRPFDAGEGRIHFARGLPLGLQGKILEAWPPEFQPEPVAATPGTDRVFARLLAAWLEHREPAAAVVPECLWLAARHAAQEVLPFARTIAADRFLHDREPPRRLYAAALAVVARFGTREDRPLFERFFKDESVIATFELEGPNPVGAKVDGKGATQLRDAAAGLALVLHGEDPAKYGFVIAGGRWTQTVDRAVVGRWDPCAFGFLNGDDESRLAAHAKVEAFLAERANDPSPREKR